MRRHELDRLVRLARLLGIDALWTRQIDDEWFAVNFDENDAACPFLEAGTNLCRIYDERPDACRGFPERPMPRCLAWPG